jgi:hypothetical protein
LKEMILNEEYYNTLINKYSNPQDCNKVVFLSISMILDNYRNKNVHFNFPRDYDLQQIINLLYEYFSKQIFSKYAALTDYSVGDRLKRTREQRRNNIYVIKKIEGNEYVLTKEDDSNLEMRVTFDLLKKYFIKIQKNTKNATLLKYSNYFKQYNEYKFLPTHFSKKACRSCGSDNME